jgi:hypothetical protein
MAPATTTAPRLTPGAAADDVEGGRAVVNATPPPGLVAAAERDYHGMRVSVGVAVRGARLLLAGRGWEVEAFTDVYHVLSRTDPRVAAAMGAAAIVQLAKQPEQRRAGT